MKYLTVVFSKGKTSSYSIFIIGPSDNLKKKPTLAVGSIILLKQSSYFEFKIFVKSTSSKFLSFSKKCLNTAACPVPTRIKILFVSGFNWF